MSETYGQRGKPNMLKRFVKEAIMRKKKHDGNESSTESFRELSKEYFKTQEGRSRANSKVRNMIAHMSKQLRSLKRYSSREPVTFTHVRPSYEFQEVDDYGEIGRWVFKNNKTDSRETLELGEDALQRGHEESECRIEKIRGELLEFSRDFELLPIDIQRQLFMSGADHFDIQSL